MVLLHYKKVDTNQFLYQIPANTSIDIILDELIEINNLRIKIDKLAVSIEDLATYGYLKPEALRGLSDPELAKEALINVPKDQLEYIELPKLQNGMRFNQDPSHYRLGAILNEQLTSVMIEEVKKAKEYISKSQVEQYKKPTTVEGCKDIINNLRGSIMIGYPGYHGLPYYEPAVQILENKYDFENRNQDVFEWYDIKNSSLWWAGKELLRGKLLSDYVGKNDKTKIIIKIQKAGQGAPVRESQIDEQTYKKMLAFYHKKQEEHKQLEEDNEDAYLNSPWANSKNLKNQLNGARGGDISWKFK